MAFGRNTVELLIKARSDVKGAFDSTSKELGNLEASAKRASSGISGIKSPLGSVISLAAPFVAGFVSITAATAAFSAVIQKGIKAVDDYKVSVASIGAITLSFMEKQGNSDVGEMWGRAKGYAEGLVPVIEEISAATLLSGDQANALAFEFLKNKQLIDSSNKAQVEGLKSIANALYVVTGGRDLDQQIITEIGHLMSGQITAQDKLGKLLLAMNPDLKEQLEVWIRQGTAVENIGNLLSGFGPATAELESSWAAVTSTLDTTVNQILREGMKPLYEDIIEMIRGMQSFLEDHKTILQEGILKSWIAVKGFIKASLDLLTPHLTALKTASGLVMMILDGWGAIFAVLPAITDSAKKLLNLLIESVLYVKDIVKMIGLTLIGDFAGANEIAKKSQKFWSGAGKTLGDVFAGGFKDEVDRRLSEYYFGKPKESKAKPGKITFEKTGETTTEKGEKVKAEKPIKTKEESMIPFLEAALTELRAKAETQMTELDSQLNRGLVSVRDYFAERRKIFEDGIEKEISLLRFKKGEEDDLERRAAINAQIVALEEKRTQEIVKLRDQEIEAEDRITQKKLQVQDILDDLRKRTAPGLESQYAQELAALDEKHRDEIQKIEEALAAKELIKEKEAAINEAYRLQEVEKDKLLADQQKRQMLTRLETAANVAGGISDVFQQMYELSGKKNKEMFYLSKAAALAEATIRTANAIVGALGSPPYGPMAIANAAVVSAMGGIQIAKIAAQKLATGGRIAGYSQSESADNIPIMATAGEYMQPVSAVRYYGSQVMEAMRQRLIPREMFSNFRINGLSPLRPSYAFATGGEVTSRQGGGQQNMSIVNLIDPSLFDQYLATNAGQKTIINVLHANHYEVRKIVSK